MKRKIEILREKPQPDPPPFICDVCNIEREHFYAIHRGEKSMCWHHEDRSPRLRFNALHEMDWHDALQLRVITSVIGVLRNECR